MDNVLRSVKNSLPTLSSPINLSVFTADYQTAKAENWGTSLLVCFSVRVALGYRLVLLLQFSGA